MKTRREFLDILRDRERWPGFRRPDFLEELNHVADDAFAKDSLEGYLASFLIYQQLCEEFLRVLIETTHFLVQCSMFPCQVPDKKLDRMTFGQLIAEYETGVQASQSKELIDKCRKLNHLRINMVHRITRKSSIASISRQTKRAKQLFDDIWQLFDAICDYFRLGLKDYKKDIEDLEECLEEFEREERSRTKDSTSISGSARGT